MKINKQKMLKIGLPILAVGLIAFYFWNKKRKQSLIEGSVIQPEVKTPVTAAPATSSPTTSASMPGQPSKVVPPINTGIAPPKVTSTTVAFDRVLPYENNTLPKTDKRVNGAKFLITTPNPAFKAGQTIIVDSPLYKGEAYIWYVWNNAHLMTYMPYVGTSAGTVRIK